MRIPLAFMVLIVPALVLAEPTDPLFQDQSNLRSEGVDAVGAWATTKGRGAIICLLDDGVDWFHDDLRNAYFLNAGEFPASITPGADGVLGLEDFPLATTDVNGNGVIDTEDIILHYSNRLDDDGNGFIDDLAGWDFDDDDNDAYDLWENSHGTGRAGILAAAENGLGSVGLAPEAKILPVRVGDKILHSADTLAQAVIYCADMGADSINMSLGGAGGSVFLRDAFRYARDKGVVAANASGNESHYHHNFNAVLNDVIAVGSVIEAASPEGPWTEKNNTTDYGAKLELAAPTDSWTVDPFTGDGNRKEGGTSSAAPHVAAGAALVKQAARLKGMDLTALQVRHILQNTATDIQGTKWGAGKGWDPFTGFGRVDYVAAMDEVDAERIPPEASIESPAWFEVISPGGSPVLRVTGYADAPGDHSFQYELFYHVGVTGGETLERYVSATSKSAVSGRLDSVAGANGLLLDGIVVPQGDALLEIGNPQSNALTLLLRVTDEVTGLVSEARRVVYLVDDEDTLPGFPRMNTASIEAPLLAVDLDGDGADELVYVDSDGYLTALGNPSPYLRGRVEVSEGEPGDGGFRFRTHLNPYITHPDAPAYKSGAVTPTYEPIIGSPAAADLDGDGLPEIVVPGILGNLYAFRGDGTRFWSAPVTTDYSRYPGETKTRARLYSSAVLADLDGDGVPEIIAGAQDQQIYAWKADGSRVPGFPVFLSNEHSLADVESGAFRPAPVASVPAVGDVNGDGQVDLVVGTNEIKGDFFGHIHIVDGRGNEAPGGPFVLDFALTTVVSPFGLPVIGEGVSGGITLADLDDDGKLEIIAGGFSGIGAIWNSDGTLRTLLGRNRVEFGDYSNVGEPLLAGWTNAMATVADLDFDGRPEIFAAALGLGGLVQGTLTESEANGPLPDMNHLVTGWNADGSFLPHFPKRIEGWAILTSPLIADVDGDRVPEVIVGSSGYYLHAYRKDGSEPEGWPKFTGGWLFATPTVADVDGDGLVEVFAAVREGQLFGWKTKGRVADAPYPQMRGGPDRSGLVDWRRERVPVGTAGCGCATTAGSIADALPFLVLALFGIVRRLRRSV